MAHFILIYMMLILMIAMALVVVAGHRVQTVSSMAAAVVNLLQYTLLGDPVGDETLQVRHQPCIQPSASRSLLTSSCAVLRCAVPCVTCNAALCAAMLCCTWPGLCWAKLPCRASPVMWCAVLAVPQTIMDPTIAHRNLAERFLAQLLRILLPLFMFHIMFAFLLAILLDPYW
jgi:hypothetical protein